MTNLTRIVAVLVVIAVLAVLAALLARGTRRRGALERLIGLCHGDRTMAERLIAGEEQRRPGTTRRQRIDRAIARLRDDRRR